MLENYPRNQVILFPDFSFQLEKNAIDFGVDELIERNYEERFLLKVSYTF
ncbi:hypothetical protein [Enterococcus sp. AZ126]